jgi:hypothetical protein
MTKKETWIFFIGLAVFVAMGLLACANNRVGIKHEVITLTYPSRTFVCVLMSDNIYQYQSDCGYVLPRCTEKDTEDYYDMVACVPALIRKID